MSSTRNLGAYDSVEHKAFCKRWHVYGRLDDYPVWNELLKRKNELLDEKRASTLAFDIEHKFGLRVESKSSPTTDRCYSQRQFGEKPYQSDASPQVKPLIKDLSQLQATLDVWTERNLIALFTDCIFAYLNDNRKYDDLTQTQYTKLNRIFNGMCRDLDRLEQAQTLLINNKYDTLQACLDKTSQSMPANIRRYNELFSIVKHNIKELGPKLLTHPTEALEYTFTDDGSLTSISIAGGDVIWPRHIQDDNASRAVYAEINRYKAIVVELPADTRTADANQQPTQPRPTIPNPPGFFKSHWKKILLASILVGTAAVGIAFPLGGIALVSAGIIKVASATAIASTISADAMSIGAMITASALFATVGGLAAGLLRGAAGALTDGKRRRLRAAYHTQQNQPKRVQRSSTATARAALGASRASSPCSRRASEERRGRSPGRRRLRSSNPIPIPSRARSLAARPSARNQHTPPARALSVSRR